MQVFTSSDHQSDCYLFVQRDALHHFFEKMLCYSCQSSAVQFEIVHEKSCGFAVKGPVKCTSCVSVIHEVC